MLCLIYTLYQDAMVRERQLLLIRYCLKCWAVRSLLIPTKLQRGYLPLTPVTLLLPLKQAG